MRKCTVRVRGVITLPAYKDKVKGTWYVSFYYNNWKGERLKKLKRGFTTKKEAMEWERIYVLQQNADLSMDFASFLKIYYSDNENRLKENTWLTKVGIIESKIMPYFSKRRMDEILPRDIIKWQNTLINYRNEKGKAYSPTYLKTIHNQISSIFNHAVRYYELKSNPAAKAGNMGKSVAKEMKFWTKEEYLKFADSMMNKPISFNAFEMLYWCGIRTGELLALITSDLNFIKGTVSITKSYQRIKGRDVITDPKTPKSNRVIKMPDFLIEEMQEYLTIIYGIQPDDRIFPITKSYLHHEMDRGAKEQNIQRIRVHDLRHSHVSLLIEMGYSALAIADRLGHKSIEVTYRYAHLFPFKQTEMANQLNIERRSADEKES